MSGTGHTVKSYEEEMQSLNDNLVMMGSLTENQMADAMAAVIKVDKESVDKIVKNDGKINELRSTIDNQITTVLVKRAPMAVDLRITISTMKISHDLERIGDLAKSVAKKVKPLPVDLPDELIGSLRRLGDLVQKQLKDALDAYLNRSKDKAIEIWKKDEQVDDLTNLAMNEVATYLQKDKKNLEMATHLLFVTKNIERAGDHITNIATLLTFNLQKEGYKVSSSSNGEEALSSIKEKKPDLVLLDWMLPDLSGIKICQYLKQDEKVKNIPIIMLTAKGEEEDKVKGLNTGAEDYMTKPFSFPELLARIKSLLKRVKPNIVSEEATYLDLKIDRESMKVFRKEKEITLGPKEYKLLDFLIKQPKRVYSREQLLEHVWGDDINVESRTVDVHITRLRQSINIEGAKPLIRTVRSAGYSLEN